MKILVVAPHLPATPRMPGSPRLFQFCRHLSRRHDLTLIAKDGEPERRALFAADAEAREVFPRVIHLPAVPRPTWLRQQVHRLRVACHLRTDLRHPEYHRRVAALLETTLRTLGDDALVYVDGLEMTQYVPSAGPHKAIVDLHDCLAYLLDQQVRIETRLRLRLALRLERRSVARWERSLHTTFAAVILNSAIDADMYRRLVPTAPALVISNGVDTDYYVRSREPQERPVLVFTGVMDYRPNEDAAIYFCDEVLPRIARTIPDVEFRIVGANPTRAVRQLARIPGVRVLGSVPDIRPHLEDASIFVCPLRYGAGMKNKVLTALAMRMPVVATSTSLANIEVQPGTGVLVGDEPEIFARQVVTLLMDGRLAATLAARGRAVVVERYSWKQRGDQLEALLTRIAGRPAPIHPRGISDMQKAVP